MAEEIHIGKSLKEISKTLGFTQEELAKLMGVTQPSISKLFQSEDIDEETLEKFAKVTGMPLKFIKNFNPSKYMKTINNLNEGSNNTNVGNNEINNQTFNITQNDLAAVLLLGREKEVLLIKGHIAQLKHNMLVAKMNNLPDSEIKEMQELIAEKGKEIQNIEEKIRGLI